MKTVTKVVLGLAALAFSAPAISSNQCSGSVLNGSPTCDLINSEGVSNSQIRAWQSGNWQSNGGWASFYASIWNPTFLATWDNNDNSSNHKEFDVSFSRSVYTGGGKQGYGKKNLRYLYDNEWKLDTTMTARGKWENSPKQYGKAHVQVIMWLNKKRGTDSNSNQNAIDITVAEWMTNQQRNYLHKNRNTGHYRQFYEDANYRFYKAPGGVGELATYLVVRKSNRNWHNGRTAKSTVNWLYFIKKIRDQDWMNVAGYKGKFNDNWYLSSMGWEITGANKDTSIGFSQGSKGKFQFSCLEIPNLDPSASTNGVGYAACR